MYVCIKEKFITGQNEREETTQDAIVTKSAAFSIHPVVKVGTQTQTQIQAAAWHKKKLVLHGSRCPSAEFR
jgi:hypothetical protein